MDPVKMNRGCSSAVTAKEQRIIKNATSYPPFHMNFIVVVLVVIDSLLTLGCTLKFYELCCILHIVLISDPNRFLYLSSLILWNRIKQSTFNDDVEKTKRRQMHKMQVVLMQMHTMNFTNHFEQHHCNILKTTRGN